MSTAIQKKENNGTALDLLESMKGEIARALPRHLSADRISRIVITECRKNPKLLDCDKFSFIGAVIQSAQLGLEVGSGLGHAYLIPYGKECQFITGYKGLTDLCRRSGAVAGISVLCVYKGELFDYGVQNGVEYVNHRPVLGKKSDKDIVAAYAIGNLTSGGAPQIAVMSVDEIIEIRDTKSKGANSASSPWKLHFPEMCKKTVVRRLAKMLPQSPDVITALHSEENGKAHQPFVDAGIIDVEYNPAGNLDPAKHSELTKQASNQTDYKTASALDKEIDDALMDFESICAQYDDKKLNVDTVLSKVQSSRAAVQKLSAEKIRAATKFLTEQYGK